MASASPRSGVPFGCSFVVTRVASARVKLVTAGSTEAAPCLLTLSNPPQMLAHLHAADCVVFAGTSLAASWPIRALAHALGRRLPVFDFNKVLNICWAVGLRSPTGLTLFAAWFLATGN